MNGITYITDETDSKNDTKQSLEDRYNQILAERSNIKANGEMLFTIFDGLKVLIKELCDKYGSDRIVGLLKDFLSDENEQDNNLFEFIKFVEPDKDKRSNLYKGLLELGEQTADGINDEDCGKFYYTHFKERYRLMVKQTVAEGQSLDTILGKIFNFKHLFDFKFNAEMLDHFGFYDKLQELNGNVILSLEELRNVFVTGRQNKLGDKLFPLLEELEEKLLDLKKQIAETESELLKSVNQARVDFNENFSISNLDEVDELTQSGIDAFRQSIESLKKSAEEIKSKLEQEQKEAEEKRDMLLRIVNGY